MLESLEESVKAVKSVATALEVVELDNEVEGGKGGNEEGRSEAQPMEELNDKTSKRQ